MAISTLIRVMVLTFTSSLLLSCLNSLALASICPEKQYLNAELQQCLNCTQCKNGMVVLRPCEFHRDTHCAPLSELLKTMGGGVETANPHRHKHNHHHQKHHKEEGEIIWRYGDDIKNDHQDIVHEEPQQPVPLEAASSQAPFSSAETLVWDWQAIALTSAVFTCILFFLVIAFYSLHQAKQWRRLKENFDADVEELSARLSLMAASTSENELLKEAGLGSIADPNYLNSRCVYLEQLLSDRKDGQKIGTLPKGNVYIEESNSKGQ
nr:tumor necrosis factor receptor superfamily member wengen [Leptinotarsa decemlineata]